MQGYAVRLSNFVVNACLGAPFLIVYKLLSKLIKRLINIAFIIRYSEENVLDSVSVVLLQVYTLLLCAFISMARKQLSIADAHFAITSTVTPLSIYLLYASFRKILKKTIVSLPSTRQSANYDIRRVITCDASGVDYH